MCTGSRENRALLLLAGLLVIVVSVLYVPGLSGPWLFDDTPNLLENRALQEFSWTQFDDLRDLAVSGQAGPLGRPVSLLSFAWQVKAGEALDPHSVKAFNLALHILIGCVLGYLALKVFLAWGVSRKQAKVAALLTAALWCAAPLHVSTVMYSVQRMSQLSALFVLLGLAIYASYRQRWVDQYPPADQCVAMLLWLTLVFFLGIYSKENAALMLPLLVLVEVAVFGGVVAGVKRPLIQRVSTGVLVCCLLAPMILYFMEPQWLSESYEGRNFTLEDRVAVQVPLLWKYVQWSLLPNLRSLVFLQDGQWALLQTSWALFAGSAAWLAAFFLAMALKSRELIFSMAFFLLAHSLESTVLALEVSYEHRNYLPSAGLLIGVVAAVLKLGKSFSRIQLSLVFLSLLLLVGLIMLALRTQIWSSSESIYRYAYQHSPESPRARFLYAAALLDVSNVRASDEDAVLLRQARLVEARQRLIELATAETSDIAALALLLRIDSSVFPQLAGKEPWAALLIEALETRRLQAEDYAALSFLTDCLTESLCKMSTENQLRFVQTLDGMTSRSAFVGGLRARLSNDRPGERRSIYEGLAIATPEVSVIHARLIELYSQTGERGKAIYAMEKLMSVDSRRTFLKPMVRAVE